MKSENEDSGKTLFSVNPISGRVECYTEEGQFKGFIVTYPFENLVRLYQRRRKRLGMTAFEKVNYYISDDSGSICCDADFQWYRFNFDTMKWEEDEYLQKNMYPGSSGYDCRTRISEEEAVDFILNRRRELANEAKKEKQRERYWRKKFLAEGHTPEEWEDLISGAVSDGAGGEAETEKGGK